MYDFYKTAVIKCDTKIDSISTTLNESRLKSPSRSIVYPKSSHSSLFNRSLLQDHQIVRIFLSRSTLFVLFLHEDFTLALPLNGHLLPPVSICGFVKVGCVNLSLDFFL